MKSFLKAPIAGLLALLARAVLAKYRPQVVMVTGSVGKTSTKDAIAAALSSRFLLRASEKSYNSEFGVPLTIIGAKNPWLSPSAWLGVFRQALALLFLPNHYPRLLVLEVGADRPGDLRKILEIATPDAVVVTRLPSVPVHVEAYASPQAVREEEFTPAYGLPKGAPLIVCAEDEHARELAKELAVTVSTFGYADDADTRIENLLIRTGNSGMEATLRTKDGSHPFSVEGSLGKVQLYAPAAAFTLARALGLSAKEALSGLKSYVPPPGRGRLLEGKNGSTLIDDTYNASPAAVEEILRSLCLANAKRRIAVLGDMLELGRYSKEEHARVGKLAADCADIVIAVGTRSRAVADAAREAGKSEQEALHFDTASEAAGVIATMVTEGDLVLIKGSQSIRMERITEALLAHPKDRDKLVRQDKEWLNKS